LGHRDREDWGSRSACKKVSEIFISKNKLDVNVYICIPSYSGGIGRIVVPYWSWEKRKRPYLKNN
jgi:hypothetical protein